MSEQYVFGYGSLTHYGLAAERAEVHTCRLRDHRRMWNVAMDNSLDLPGYKHYLSADGSSRPGVFVTFLNLVPAPGSSVNGVLLRIRDAELPALDRRERNYERIDVAELLDVQLAARVWCYFGSGAARERFELGLAGGTAVVDERYRDAVREGFALLGAEALAEFDASTDPPRCAVTALTRVDT
jgi:Gamma-glutamyl cyclotransferase, AIG2-like